MVLHTAKGTKEYKTKDFDFVNVMCDLEDRGVDIMKMMDSENPMDGKVFSTMRIILATLIGEKDLAKAGHVLTEHLRNGGQMDEIFNVFTEVMETAGFGIAEETETPKLTEETATEA